jgi:signal transduction histidine kinase/pSer/pThr/pTyr-binding forkhead associated (FHA) protein
MVRLKVYDGQEKVKDLELGATVVSIGREPTNQLALSDVSVSRRHAQIEPNGNFFLIRDNGSTNGTFVNETLTRVHVLSHGDTIRIGKYLLRVDTGKSKGRDSTRVRVEHVSFPGLDASRKTEPPAATARIDAERDAAATSNARLLRLYEIQSEIGHIDAPEALLERVVDLILLELKAERGGLLLCERAAGAPGGYHFVPAAVRCAAGVEEDEELVIPEELLATVATTREALQVKGPGEAQRPALVAPLQDRGIVRGVVYIDRLPSQGAFSDEDLQFLSAIAGQAAISLSNAQLFEDASTEKEKLQAVFTSLTDGVLVTDLAFGVLEANAAAAVLLGLKERNPLGLSLFEVFTGFDLSPSADVLRAAGPREGAVFQLTRPAPTENPNAQICITGKITPYPAGASDRKGLVVTLRDRSEVVRVETLKTQFIGNVAHKLRSPLTVIESNLPLLRATSEDDAQVFEEVERNSRTLCHLVNQFIEFTEMELRSARFRTAPEQLKLKPLLRDAVRKAEKDASQKGILVVERLRDDLPQVLGRAEHLLRAFQHILDNAVKFSGHGGQVVIEGEDIGGCVRIDFIDDGPGIPREQIESVFYVCHQIDEERTGQVPGAGLGLTVARQIVQEHGGEIQVTSPFRLRDRGTRVSVMLPVKAAAGENSPDSQASPAVPVAGACLQGGSA